MKKGSKAGRLLGRLGKCCAAAAVIACAGAGGTPVVKPVQAASATLSRAAKYHVTTKGIYGNGASSWRSHFSINGRTMYCTDYKTHAAVGKSHTKTSIPNSVKGDKLKKLKTVGYYGYGYNGDRSGEMYAATQTLVWEIMHDRIGKASMYKKGKGGAGITEINVNVANGKLSSLRSKMNSVWRNFESGPSIGRSYRLAGPGSGKAATVKDGAGMLSEYKVSSASGLQTSISGNTLKIWSNSVFTGTKTITLQFKKNNSVTGAGDPEWWTKSGHQSFTNLSYGSHGDIKLSVTMAPQKGSFAITKTGASDGKALKGAEYTLTGGGKTRRAVSDTEGVMKFTDLDPGAYTLQETKSPSAKYKKSSAKMTVKVASDGKVTIDGKAPGKVSDSEYETADIELEKAGSADGKPAAGAQFWLRGTSDADSEDGTKKQYSMYATSGADGKVKFSGLRKGIYQLSETAAPEGYSLFGRILTVKVTGKGAYTITDDSKKSTNKAQLSGSKGSYVLKETQLREFSIKKTDSAGQKLLRGATFRLSGTSDGGKAVSIAKTTGANGIATFSGLEPGTYSLVETAPPEGYSVDGKTHWVKVPESGDVTSDLQTDEGMLWFPDAEGEKPRITVTKQWRDENASKRSLPVIRLDSGASDMGAYNLLLCINADEDETAKFADINGAINGAKKGSEDDYAGYASDTLIGLHMYKGMGDWDDNVAKPQREGYEPMGVYDSPSGGKLIYSIKSDGSLLASESGGYWKNNSKGYGLWQIDDATQVKGYVQWKKKTFSSAKARKNAPRRAAAKTGRGASGTWNGCKWSIDSAGTLTLSGTLKTTVTIGQNAPWCDFVTTGHTPTAEQKANAAAVKKIVLAKDFMLDNSVKGASSMFSVSGAEEIDMTNFKSKNSRIACANMFQQSPQDGYHLKKITGLSALKRYKITDASGMFCSCKSLSSCGGDGVIDITGLDFSQCGTFRYMFSCCAKIKKIKGLDAIDTSSGTEFVSMFAESGLEKLEVRFNTSKGKHMSKMFHGMMSLEELDISRLDTTNSNDEKEAVFGSQGGVENMLTNLPSLKRLKLGSKTRLYMKTASGKETYANLPQSPHNRACTGKWTYASKYNHSDAKLPRDLSRWWGGSSMKTSDYTGWWVWESANRSALEDQHYTSASGVTDGQPNWIDGSLKKGETGTMTVGGRTYVTHDLSWADETSASHFATDASGRIPGWWEKLDSGRWAYTFNVEADASWTAHESEVPDGYETDHPAGSPLAIAKGTLGKNAVITNTEKTLKTGSLRLTKKCVQADGTDETTDAEFSFSVMLTDENGSVPSGSEPIFYGSTMFMNGRGSVTLKSGEKAVFTGIPAGWKYVITEEGASGYASKMTGASGTIAEDATAACEAKNVRNTTNPPLKKEYGSLRITKKVDGNNSAVTGGTFTVRVVITGLLNSSEEPIGVKTVSGGKTEEKDARGDADSKAVITLSLKSGGYADITDIETADGKEPQVWITEDGGSWTASGSVSGTKATYAKQEGEKGEEFSMTPIAIESGRRADVTISNHATSANTKLFVTKLPDSDTTLGSGEKFGFTAEFRNLEKDTVITAGDDEIHADAETLTATYHFELGKNETMAFQGVPAGSEHRITEDAQQDFQASFYEKDGTMSTSGVTGDGELIPFNLTGGSRLSSGAAESHKALSTQWQKSSEGKNYQAKFSNSRRISMALRKADADSSGKELAGAAFTARRVSLDSGSLKTEMTKKVTTDSHGMAYLADLEPGLYIIEETTAPSGYGICRPMIVRIGADGEVQKADVAGTARERADSALKESQAELKDATLASENAQEWAKATKKLADEASKSMSSAAFKAALQQAEKLGSEETAKDLEEADAERLEQIADDAEAQAALTEQRKTEAEKALKEAQETLKATEEAEKKNETADAAESAAMEILSGADGAPGTEPWSSSGIATANGIAYHQYEVADERLHKLPASGGSGTRAAVAACAFLGALALAIERRARRKETEE